MKKEMKKEASKGSKQSSFKALGGSVKKENTSPSIGGDVWSSSGHSKMKETK